MRIAIMGRISGKGASVYGCVTVYAAAGAGGQRCWVHKTVNVLDKLPRSQQPSAKSILHEIGMSATKDDALNALDRFVPELLSNAVDGIDQAATALMPSTNRLP